MPSSIGRQFVLFAALSLVVVASAVAGGQSEGGTGGGTGTGEDIDYIGIAAVMIRDGNYERAERALQEVDLADEEIDLQRYYTLSGLLALRRGENDQAIEAFTAATEAGQTDPSINVYLAQAYSAEGRYEESIEAIDRVPNLAQFPALYSLLAEGYWRTDQKDRAYDTLDRAIDLFPSQAQFLRQQIFYLIELNLTQAAVEKSRLYIERLEDDPAAYVTVGEALRRGGDPQVAVETLEMGRLLHPGNRQIHLALAQAYLDLGHSRSAGAMVERAAAYDASLYFEAAEIYRRAGEFERALYLNSLVIEEERKAIQRFHILLAMERYESAVALESRLDRVGALVDDANRYAMAFALFQTRQFERAIDYINRIEGSDYFRRATQLRQAIETVRDAESLEVG